MENDKKKQKSLKIDRKEIKMEMHAQWKRERKEKWWRENQLETITQTHTHSEIMKTVKTLGIVETHDYGYECISMQAF